MSYVMTKFIHDLFSLLSPRLLPHHPSSSSSSSSSRDSIGKRSMSIHRLRLLLLLLTMLLLLPGQPSPATKCHSCRRNMNTSEE